MIGRLGAGSLVLLSLVLVGLAMHAVWSLIRNNHSLNDVKARHELVELYHAAEVALLETQASGERFGSTRTAEDRSDFEMQVAGVVAALTQLTMSGGAEELALMSAIFAQHADELEALPAYIDAVQAGEEQAFEFDTMTVPAIAAQLSLRRAEVSAESENALADFRSGLDDQVFVALGVFGFGLPLALGAMVFLLRYQRNERVAEFKVASLKAISSTDSLTGVGNLRAFQDQLAEEAVLARKDNSVLSLALLDLDYFKNVNDELGHPEGDYLLARFGSSLQRLDQDPEFGRVSAFRLGGDEFALLMPRIDELQAHSLLALLKQACPEFLGDRTFSAGIAVSKGNDIEPEELRKRADASLYLAKRAGRDRVVTNGAPAEPAA